MNEPELVERLRDRLTAVLELADNIRDTSHPTAEELAETVATSDAVALSNQAAEQLALLVGYGIRGDAGDRRAGRTLSSHSIRKLGLATAVVSGDKLDKPAVVADLVAYLAGPIVESLHLVGIDADLVLTRPLTFDGWQLHTAEPDWLRSVAMAPSPLAHQPSRPWDSDLWDRIAFLSRPVTRPPVTGLRWSLPRAFPEWDVWRPLTTLALAQPDVVTMWCEYDVEPGRDVHELFNDVWYEFASYGMPDETDVVETPGWLSINLRPGNEDEFENRLRSISALLPPEPPEHAGKSTKAKYSTIERACQRLLAAGRHARGTATPWEPIRAMDSLLHYVVALESLLGGDTSQGEINRKIVQRSAILAGRSDQERLSSAKQVRDAYTLRSKVMHGAADPLGPELDQLRVVVRRVLLARLVHEQFDTNDLELRCD